MTRMNTLIGCRMSALSADAGEMIPLLPLAGKRAQGVLQSLPLGGIINQCKGFPPREFKQFAIAQRIGDVEAQVPSLARAEKLSRTAELEIGFSDLESIGCAHHGLEPRAGFISQAGRRHQNAVRLPRATANPPAELMQLREPEALRVFDDHHRRVRHVHARSE